METEVSEVLDKVTSKYQYCGRYEAARKATGATMSASSGVRSDGFLRRARRLGKSITRYRRGIPMGSEEFSRRGVR